MNTPTGPLVVWQSGRLVSRAPAKRFEFGRDQWIGAALLVACAIVFTLYVALLEQDLERGRLVRDVQQARALDDVRGAQSSAPAAAGPMVAGISEDAPR
ncbi:MAG: hypothetical protein ABW032_03075 [Burkholderiaceae bacterium]